MKTILSDFRFGLRSARKDWRFAAMVVLTLTICIGANTALFTIVNSVLLQPLPVPEASRIVLTSNKYPKAGVSDIKFSSAADYFDRARVVTALEDQAMFRETALTLNENGGAERVDGISATPSFFRLVRVRPVLGRTFLDKEGEVGAEKEVILSYPLWQKLYAGSPAVIGRDLRLNGRQFTIVGVMPKGFLFVNPEARYWIPLAFRADQKDQYHNNNWYNVGRMKPGATLAQVQSQIDALNKVNLERFPQFKPILLNAGFHSVAAPLKDVMVEDVRGTLYLLWGGAVFVLLIGAVNITNLALARANARIKEFATRLAIGASHSQITRQLLAENLIIAWMGGAAGLALGAGIVEALGKFGLDRFPRAEEVHAGGAAIAFALAVSFLTGIFVALVPLAGILKANLTTALRDSSRGGTSGKRARRLREGLVVAQIGFAFVLLAGAGLLLASFRQLLNLDPGFKTEGILTASTSAPHSRYAGDPELRNLMRRSLESIRAIPGVRTAGATTMIPLNNDTNDSVIFAEGYQMKPGESVISPLRLVVTPGYMEAMSMPLVRGRYFDERDREGVPRVIIVDERLAKKFWPNQDPIGRRMYQPSAPGPDLLKIDEHTQWLRVIGVVQTARIQNLTETGNLSGAYYFPFAQTPEQDFTFAISTATTPTSIAPAVRSAIAQVDPLLALFEVETMQERKQLSLASRRTAMSLALAFGGLALFLSAVGIYSVLSYLLGQRRREIGIRLAVGSSPAGIFRLFLSEGVVLVGAGLVLGLIGSSALRKAVENQIYGVQPMDPFVLAAVIAILGSVALGACLRPAQQATKVDPIAVLNEQ